MDHPENETMEVLVTVAFPPFETRSSEEAWEQDIVNAVSAAVYADKTLDTLSVRRLEYEDCQWVFESGMPMPDYGVTVGQHTGGGNIGHTFGLDSKRLWVAGFEAPSDNQNGAIALPATGPAPDPFLQRSRGTCWNE